MVVSLVAKKENKQVAKKVQHLAVHLVVQSVDLMDKDLVYCLVQNLVDLMAE